MTKCFEKEIKVLFGNDILKRAKGLNLLSMFTNDQVEIIENSARQILAAANDSIEQQRIVADLNLETSLLLCVWMMRGGHRCFDQSNRHTY